MPATVKNYFSLIKFSHTIFAMPFALIGFFLAIHSTHHSFEWLLLLKVILCMVFARTAAMAFNRYADCDVDSINERTKNREIPGGIIPAHAALLLVIISSVFFVATTYTINNACLILSPIALVVVLGYSYTKRFTSLCHLVLGVGLALAPIGAYLAVAGKFDLLPVLFALCVLCWVSGFDIIYALQDEEFDKSNHLFSIPAQLGKARALLVSNILHVAAALFILIAGWLGRFGFMYWTGSAIFISLLVYQHSLVKPTDLRKVNVAFFTTNGVASVIFAAFVLADFYLRR